jgi:hypothetical protein
VIQPVTQADQLQRDFGLHRRARDLGDDRDILARGETGNQVVELEHEADVKAAVGGEFALAGAGQVAAGIQDFARGGRIQSAENVQQRRFAAARCAQ